MPVTLRTGNRSAKRPTWTSSTPLSTAKDLKPLPSYPSKIDMVVEVSSELEAGSSKSPEIQKSDKKKPTFLIMVCNAIKEIDEKKGASVQAIKKFLIGYYNCEDTTRLNKNIKAALLKGLNDEILSRPKSSALLTGARGCFLISKTKKPKVISDEKAVETLKSKTKKLASKNSKQKSEMPTIKASEPGKKANKPKPSGSKKQIPEVSKPKKGAKVKTAVSANGKVAKNNKSKKPVKPKAQKEDDTDSGKNSETPKRNLKKRHEVSPVSDVTVTKPDLTEIVKMNFSDTELSATAIAAETLGRPLKTTVSSLKHPKVTEMKRSKKKRLSLKTSRLRKRSIITNVKPQKNDIKTRAKAKMLIAPNNSPGSPEDEEVFTPPERNSKMRKEPIQQTDLQDLSADSIIVKPTKRMLRRKSSI